MNKINYRAPFPDVLRAWAAANRIRTDKEAIARLGVSYFAWLGWAQGRRACPAAGALIALMRLKMDRRLQVVPAPWYTGQPFPEFMRAWMDDMGFMTHGEARPYRLQHAASSLCTSPGTWKAWFHGTRQCTHEAAFRELMLLKRAVRETYGGLKGVAS